MPYADVGAQRIYFEDTGSGPAVVFAHGFLMDHEMWRAQIDALEHEFRCIAYDERGFGQSETDDQPFDYWDLAADLRGLLDHLGIERAAIVGLSQGGFLAMRLALTDPDRVRGLVLADTDPHAFAPEVAQVYRSMFEATITNGMDETMVATLRGILFAPDFADSRYWEAKWTSRPPVTLRHAEECLASVDELGDRLGEITCPVLAVHGELDASFPVAAVHEWAASFATPANVVTVPGAGHSAPLERPDVVNPHLLEFLRSLP